MLPDNRHQSISNKTYGEGSKLPKKTNISAANEDAP